MEIKSKQEFITRKIFPIDNDIDKLEFPFNKIASITLFSNHQFKALYISRNT